MNCRNFPPEEAARVRGLQANIWTEYLYNMGLVEYMVWPRALALSERAWSVRDPRDYKSFRSRASRALNILEKLAVKYRPHGGRRLGISRFGLFRTAGGPPPRMFTRRFY